MICNILVTFFIFWCFLSYVAFLSYLVDIERVKDLGTEISHIKISLNHGIFGICCKCGYEMNEYEVPGKN